MRKAIFLLINGKRKLKKVIQSKEENCEEIKSAIVIEN